MSVSFSKVLKWSLMVLPALAMGCFLFPAKIEYNSYLTPSEKEGDYSIREDGTVSYEVSGSRVDVKYMTDRELNELFPDESSKGKYSINPYTYGDWVDPDVGYVRNRFTVFKISVFNYTFAKVELDPTRPILLTDRGETLEPYVISVTAGRNSLESYYRALRGASGNEYYRFDLRMGIVRSNNYGQDEKIFKGESYFGFIVYNPLDSEVKRVQLVLKDFILKFDAYNRPIETIDIPLDFDRHIERRELAELEAKEQEELTKLAVTEPSQLRGNIQGDPTRNVTAINLMVERNARRLNQCFSEEYEKGEALEGRVVVQFTILPSGAVINPEVTESTVENDGVGACMISQIERWRFKRSTGAPQQLVLPPPTRGGLPPPLPPEPPPQTPVTDVTVTYPFEFISLEEE